MYTHEIFILLTQPGYLTLHTLFQGQVYGLARDYIWVLRVLPTIAPEIGIMMKYMIMIAMPSWSFKGFFAVDQVCCG